MLLLAQNVDQNSLEESPVREAYLQGRLSGEEQEDSFQRSSGITKQRGKPAWSPRN